MEHLPSELDALIGKQVVVDSDSSLIYIGVLEKVGRDYLVLGDVDVHDTADSKSTKESYAHETKKLGTRTNRKLTYVRLARVVSISALDDLISF
jgi:hypothetical protein